MIPGINVKHVVLVVAATCFLTGLVAGFILGKL